MSTIDTYEEISLSSIVAVLMRHKLLVIGFTAIFAVASVALAVSLPNLYKSQAKLISNKGNEGGLGSLAGSLGGLAGIAGAALGGGDSDAKVNLAKELLKSRVFLKKFVDKHDILVPLIAAEGTDDQGNLIINQKLYSATEQKWVRDVVAPKPVTPSAEDVFLAFDKILTVEHDKKSGVVKVELEFYQPELAKQWLTWLIEDVNEEVRAQDRLEAEQSISYLQRVVEETDSAATREAFFQLIEEQTKTLLLTEVRKDYVFKSIDPATSPEEKSSPKRALICIGITLFAGVFIVMFVLVRHFAFQTNQ